MFFYSAMLIVIEWQLHIYTLRILVQTWSVYMMSTHIPLYSKDKENKNTIVEKKITVISPVSIVV